MFMQEKLHRKAKLKTYRDFAYNISPRHSYFEVDVVSDNHTQKKTSHENENSENLELPATTQNWEPLSPNPENAENLPRNKGIQKEYTELTTCTSPVFTYSYIAPYPQQLVNICDGYQLAVPFSGKEG